MGACDPNSESDEPSDDEVESSEESLSDSSIRFESNPKPDWGEDGFDLTSCEPEDASRSGEISEASEKEPFTPRCDDASLSREPADASASKEMTDADEKGTLYAQLW